MKKNLLIAMAVMALCSCAKKEFRVTVNMQNADGKMAYLQKNFNSENVVIDSAVVNNGTVVLKAQCDDPSAFYSVKVADMKRNVGFFADNNDVVLTGDFNNPQEIEKKASVSQATLDKYEEGLKVFGEKERELMNRYKEAKESQDTAFLAKFEEKYDEIDAEQNAFVKQFIKENSNSLVAHYVLYRNHYSFELEELEDFVNGFDKNVGSQYLNIINEKIEVLRRVAVGQKYLDFTMETPEHTQLALSDLVGKSQLLLLDFWASWCGPCRGENPNVVATYQEFHDKGFDVLGVSLDQNHDKWTAAIADDNLTWHHVSDLKYWSNSAAKMYGISSIPSNLLLDANGTIIAKNLRGNDLRNKVEEILGK